MAFERAQLTTHFANEILNTQKVCFSCFEATFCLFFALAILQYASSFFDDGATIFCTCGQYRVDLTLADDDVLLTANAGV